MKCRHLAVPLVLTALCAASGCTSQESGATATTTSAADRAGTTVAGTVPSIVGDTPCPAADGSSPRTLHFEKAPPQCIDPAKRYAAVVETGAGSFTIDLDAERAPNYVNNFVVLARYHYFDGLPFDQDAPDDYIGSGVHLPPASGDPGYRIPAEGPGEKADYQKAGTVIIDNEQTGDNGSLWIVLLTDKGVAPRFTIIGTVTPESLDVAKRVNTQIFAPGPSGTAIQDRAQLPKVEKVTITES